PPGPSGRGRGERRRRGELSAPERGVCGLSPCHRPAEGTRADLEERKLGRRHDGMGPPRRKFVSSSLIDTFGRIHNNLRISVTDRCNLRCTYCMPEDVVFMDRGELLTFEEITRFVEIAAGLGVDKIRLTGGEP